MTSPERLKQAKKGHTFHIPVMGTGFSIDTPIKVAKYGISSVISLVDDVLIEKMRQFYCKKTGEEYVPIPKEDVEHRAKRITAYLDLVDRIVKKQFEELRASAFEIGSEITKYFELLPETSPLKKLYVKMLQTRDEAKKRELQEELRRSIAPGDINVNIMTKLDKNNFDQNDQELPAEFSDALAALRGYAMSTVSSAIVFSAGINRRLYSYIANFQDFFADTTGYIKKRIVIKVSDYRSAITQGKFLAKKGLWVSEYRIESGLNCGGHVFPAAGELMGPILEEFKTKRKEFSAILHEIYTEALKLKNEITFPKPHDILVTAQGGIGTAVEDAFIRDYYEVDSTGWGTPFLLVPEATNNDAITLKRLSEATEKDLFISEVSPLGVPFNNLRNSESELEKERRIEKNRPGSPCPKGYLVSNTEFTKLPICTASRQYQKLKLEQIEALQLSPDALKAAQFNVTRKACICNDLGEGAMTVNSIAALTHKVFPAVCPGPNIAYFSKIATLKEMIDHIYGRTNLITAEHRPHMFIKELDINIDFFKHEIEKLLPQLSEKQMIYLNEFRSNLMKGIEYYRKLFPRMLVETEEFRLKMQEDLEHLKICLDRIIEEHSAIFANRPLIVSEAAAI